MLAEELFYRAGGLVRVRPILFEGLMLHAGAELSTALERLPGLAAALLEQHPIAPGDVLIVASNSGGNAVVARARRASPAARGDRRSSRSSAAPTPRAAAARAAGAANLHDVADVVIDNGGCAGRRRGRDRRVRPAGRRRRRRSSGRRRSTRSSPRPPSGSSRGASTPDVFLSSNVEGGDDVNARLLHGGDGPMTVPFADPGRHRGLLRQPVDPRAAPRLHPVHRPRTG